MVVKDELVGGKARGEQGGVRGCWMARTGRSFGVNRKYCFPPSLHACVMHSKTFRSLVESIAWLISSTTRNGAGLMFWSEMRYTMVATDRSPPESLPPSPKTCNCSVARHCTLIWILYSAKLSGPSGCPFKSNLRPSDSVISPWHLNRLKYVLKLSLTYE